MSIFEACKPRADILAGSFNPEIFTASLSEVLRFYRGESVGIHQIYTDAEQFLTEGTYATDGLRTVLSEVFGRLDGDNSVPAIHRLETAFGGGKTHTLIACAHLGFKGKDLDRMVNGIVDPRLLPESEEVAVVGIAGDEIAVHKPRGSELVPYTLWGEIAHQIGGKSLYKRVEEEANSEAAPGKNYFDTVFGGRKVLIMLDELAQYAARLTAASPGAGEQLAAFLLALHGYARTNPGVAVVLTLASAVDAFASQTQRLAELLSDVTGEEISKDEALGIGQKGKKGVASVVARDATGIVPVQPAEISLVLGKRLFDQIDAEFAQRTAADYMKMYAKSSSLLPDQATRSDYEERMVGHYPFHPTLIDFLNNKLATSENFQGTRGVLRVLALAVRRLWNTKRNSAVPMIHACHLDLRDARTVNELIGRTGSGELLPVLNADVGGVDTESIEGGKSNAELADLRNPHPDGWPMYEHTWKTIFLHSLVGGEQGLASNLFGLAEQDALFNVSFPGLTPSQVIEALKEIKESAYYLRRKEGRYYASPDPSINVAISRISRSLGLAEIDDLLDATARKVVSQDILTFKVVPDVEIPEHIPDKQGKPILALVSLRAQAIDVDECITTAGPNIPRVEQNLVFLLVPDTTPTASESKQSLFGKMSDDIGESRARLRDLARTGLAMRKLKDNPQVHGISPRNLEEEDFRRRFSEREKALETAVTQSYKSLWFPSASGQILRKEIRTAGGESGVSILEQIHHILLDEGEIVTAEHDTRGHLSSLAELFFKRSDTVALQKLRENFCRLRSWPILDSPTVFDQVIRSGVSRGVWCLFRMGADDRREPEEFYSPESGDLPFNLDLSLDYSLITPEGARKRSWSSGGGPDSIRIRDWIRETVSEKQIATVSDLAAVIEENHGAVPSGRLHEALSDLIVSEKLITFKGAVDQQEKPADLVSGTSAMFYKPHQENVILTPAKAAEKGWISRKSTGLSLTGKEGVDVLLPLLRRIGSLYLRGGQSTIDNLELIDLLLPKGGKLRFSITEASPESVKDLSELFEIVSELAKKGDQTEAFLEVNDPKKDCPFVQEVEKQMKKGKKV